MVFTGGKKLWDLRGTGCFVTEVLCTSQLLIQNNTLKLWDRTKTSEVSHSNRFPQANVHFSPPGIVLQMLSEI